MNSIFIILTLSALSLAELVLAAEQPSTSYNTTKPALFLELADPKNLDESFLSLSEAVKLALESNPNLNSAQRVIEIQEGQLIQAGLLPNPEISSEIEEFGGTGERSGFARSEVNIEFSQLFELGGKRGKRVRSASLGRDIAALDYERARLDVILLTTQTFIKLVADHERFEIAQDTFDLARELSKSVRNRIDAGQVSPIEQTRADLELSSSQIRLAEAKRKLSITKQRLAATWGNSTPVRQTPIFTLNRFEAPKAFDIYSAQMMSSPDVIRWEREINRREAVIAFEKSQRIPDVEVTLGGSRFEADNGKAARFGVSVPLPLFDRNQGNITIAQAQRQLSANHRQEFLLALKVKLNESYTRIASAYQNAKTLRDTVLPGAAAAYKAILASYEAGRVNFLELMYAQRTLLDVREQYMDTLESYHLYRAALERLIAQPIE